MRVKILQWEIDNCMQMKLPYCMQMSQPFSRATLSSEPEIDKMLYFLFFPPKPVGLCLAMY